MVHGDEAHVASASRARATPARGAAARGKSFAWAEDHGALAWSRRFFKKIPMIALSTLSIFTLVLCFNTALFLSLGLYLYRHRDADPSVR